MVTPLPRIDCILSERSGNSIDQQLDESQESMFGTGIGTNEQPCVKQVALPSQFGMAAD
jgi:hypothetical protein